VKPKKDRKSAIRDSSSCGITETDPQLKIEQLTRRLESFQQFYDHAPIGRFSITPEGVIKALNLMGASMLGLSLQQAIGSKLVDHLREADRAEFDEFFDMIFQHDAALPCLVCMNHSNGEAIFLSLTGVKLPNENFCHVTATDATKLLNAQIELKRTQDDLNLMVEKRTGKLRSLARELTLAEERERRRIAILVHDDLQQLLVAVLLNIGATKTKNHCHAILKELEGVELMTKKCIDVTRSLASELSPSVLHQCGLSAGLYWLRDWFSEKYGFNLEVCLEEAFIPAEDISITLFQCVREIVFNALKHSRVMSARLMIASDGEAHVNITINDQGVGFDVGGLSFQDACKGGFGLFSVRERVELVGGEVLIESAPGQGSCFTLRFPASVLNDGRNDNCCDKAICDKEESNALQDEAAVAKAPIQTSSSTVNGALCFRVVLADDHSMVRQGLVRVFRDEEDFEVVGEAANGQEACDIARELEPDIIVMDLQMPVMSGLEATRAIRKELPMVQVIGLSMDATKESRRCMLRAGALDLLHKGGSAEDLINRVRGHLVAKASAADG